MWILLDQLKVYYRKMMNTQTNSKISILLHPEVLYDFKRELEDTARSEPN